MGRFVDSVIAYRILKLLVTPFEETDAFRLGIIDAKGKELKKMADLNTAEEREAYTLLHRLVFRLKRIINKVPIENKKLVSYAAALSLIKEHVENEIEPIDLELQFLNRVDMCLNEDMDLYLKIVENTNMLTFKMFTEEAPVNNASATPGVAGFTPDTLGVSKKKRPPILTRKKVIKNV